MEMSERGLKGTKTATPHKGVEKALRIAAAQFGVSVADIRSQRRTRAIHPARLWAAYLACMTTRATCAGIGARLGGRDESIIRMYARNRARAVENDEASARIFRLLKARCFSR